LDGAPAVHSALLELVELQGLQVNPKTANHNQVARRLCERRQTPIRTM
jgi:hypothetical protein